jgi:C4-dicarboxylate transporter DctQ subunit
VKLFTGALNILDKGEEIILSVFLVEMALLTFVQVVLRYVFGSSMTWAEELLRYQLCFVAFFGADIGLKHGSHIGAEILKYILPQRFRPLLKAFIFLVIFAFCLFFTYYGLILVLKVRAMGQVTAAMRIPKYLVYLPIPIGGFFMCVRCIVYCVASVSKLIMDFKPKESSTG